MEAKKKRAMNEKDPKKRAALLLEIEEDGKLLRQKCQEYQEHSNKLRFDPEKYISGLVDAIKRAVERGGRSGSGGGGNPNRPNKPGRPDDPFGFPSGDGLPDDNPNPRAPRVRREGKDKDNSQLMLIVVAVVVVLFLMMNQKDSSNYRRDYKEDYY